MNPPDTTSLNPEVWAIWEPRLATTLEAARGIAPDAVPSVSAEFARQALTDPATRGGGVAVVPIHGPIYPKETFITRAMGWPALSTLRAALQAVMADPNISAVVLDFDSPGGMAEGVEETADLLRALRGKEKPLVAVSNTLCASAAYWLASQCDLVVAAPDSNTGSIGTFILHGEFSRMYDAAGVTVNIIRNPPRKAEVNSLEPLTEEARTRLQEIVDDTTARFQQGVAKGRGVAVADVRGGFGQGTVLMPREARTAGMVDRVATMEQVLQRLSARRRGAGPARADLLEAWPEALGESQEEKTTAPAGEQPGVEIEPARPDEAEVRRRRAAVRGW